MARKATEGAQYGEGHKQGGCGQCGGGKRVNTACPDHYEHKMPDGSYMCGAQHGGAGPLQKLTPAEAKRRTPEPPISPYALLKFFN